MVSPSSERSLTSPFPHQYDVLVIGAGAAGLYTALCLPGHFTIGLVTKEPLSLSASDWAQGGIAAAMDPQDSPSLHIHDTLEAGAGLCDYEAVRFLVDEAPRCIHSLVHLGVGFDRHQGNLALTLEAAHSRRRVLHAADTTGRAVISTLATHALTRPNIHVIQAFTLDLWLDSDSQYCRGASILYQNQIVWLQAKAIILATGGGGQVFAQTTNPALSTGDGVAIAYRAGAILRDLEFVQFHPTALTTAGAPRFLISEAVRGEGAHLVDDQGYRFAFDYHPAGELAPRDIVSRAIFNYLQKNSLNRTTAHVWLDLRPIPPAQIQQRFPNIIQVCRRWGIDVFKAPIPVAPAAHYWMGGVATNLANQTSIPGLYAVGETASTGVHGANRLASNSLLECLVFGASFADLTLENNQGWKTEVAPDPLNAKFSLPSQLEQDSIDQLRQKIPGLVWQSAGICREGSRMQAAIAQLQTWQQDYASLPTSRALQSLVPGTTIDLEPGNQAALLRTWVETRNLLDVAYLLLKSADFRTESRGGHYRTDYPHPDDRWRVHTLVQQKAGTSQPETAWWTAPVSTPGANA